MDKNKNILNYTYIILCTVIAVRLCDGLSLYIRNK